MRILVVDDNKVFLELMRSILEQKGYSDIHTSVSYVEVLKQMLDGTLSAFDLMFCDCFVPELGVLGFLSGLEKQKNKAWVVLLTGTSFEMLHSRELYARSKELNILGAIHKNQLEKGVVAMLEKVSSGNPRSAAVN